VTAFIAFVFYVTLALPANGEAVLGVFAMQGSASNIRPVAAPNCNPPALLAQPPLAGAATAAVSVAAAAPPAAGAASAVLARPLLPV